MERPFKAELCATVFRILCLKQLVEQCLIEAMVRGA